jgi:hypothetical protein
MFGEIEEENFQAPLGMQSARSSRSICTINRRKDQPLPLPPCLVPWESTLIMFLLSLSNLLLYLRRGAEGFIHVISNAGRARGIKAWEPTTVASD